MGNKTHKILHSLLFAGTLMFSAQASFAANYPERNISMLVPFPAGSATDTVARLLGEKMSDYLGQSIIVENAPGASGTIAAARLARSKPDGHHVMIHTTIALSDALYDNLSYDTATDFETIGLVNIGPYIIVSAPDFPPANAEELIELLKEKNGDIAISNAGVGTGSHLCSIMLANALEIEPNLIPYKGTNLALQDVMAGHVDLTCDQTTNAFPQLAGGHIKAYATTSPERLSAYPDVPTTSELGLADVNMAVWHGIYAPKGTDNEIVNTLNQALQVALADEKIQKALDDMGTYLFPEDQRSPEDHRQYLDNELERFKILVEEADLKFE